MTLRDRYDSLVARGDSVERATFFSDAVFAIALTLLVIEIHVPEVPERDLPAALIELLPDFGAFVLSFAVIGMVWLSHHRKFRLFVAHDQMLLRLNLLMLLGVATLPLPTGLLAGYGDTVLAVVVFAATIVGIGMLLTAIWALAGRRGYVDPRVDRALHRFMLGQSLVIPVAFVVSIPVALLVGPLAAELTWLAALPLYLVLGRVMGRRSPATPQENP